MQTDVLIAGTGCAGLFCALHLPKTLQITVITKSDAESNDSFLAQGGICVKRDDADFDSFFEDTLKAGHYENNPESVRIMIESSRDVIEDLVGFGVSFHKNPDGTFAYTREGAHSKPRILYHRDVTGKEITSNLLKEAKSRKNIRILEYTTLLDIIEHNGKCVGAVLQTADKECVVISAGTTVLATGGIGGLFKHSTNFKHLTGDAIAIALKHGIELKDIHYIQIHPTTMHNADSTERSFLISESVRGEGAKLYDKDFNRFTDELQPRDLLTSAIYAQMEKDKTEYVWEDLRDIPKQEILNHFPNIAAHCKEKGFDVTKECIPVVPAQHYFMGGIRVDNNSKTSMENLYAVGETACNGVHGKNRLASNSLLESLVFAKRAAQKISKNCKLPESLPEIDLSVYQDTKTLQENYRQAVLKEIEKEKNYV